MLVNLINKADMLYNLFRNGSIPFLIFQEAMINLGAYDVTETNFTIEGIKWDYVR